MKTTLSVIGCITLICIGYAAIEIGWLAEQERTVDLASLQTSINGTLTKFNTTLDNADAAIEVLHDAEQKQADFYDPKKNGGATQQIQRILTDTKMLIGRTDLSLNGGPNGEGAGAIPAMAFALRQAGDLSARAGVDLDVTAKTVTDTAISLKPGIDNMVLASKAAADDLADPSIHAILATTAGTSANVEMTTHDVAAFAHRELAPVKGTWNLIKAFLMEFAGPAAEIATAAK